MLKQGRKPIGQRITVADTQEENEIFGNALKIDATLRKELEDKNLECRFVDAKQLYEMGGYHKNGWLPYKRDQSAILSSSGFKFGNDPDRIVRRGSLVLAARTKEYGDKHRRLLRSKADRYAQVTKRSAQELREFATKNNIDAQIHEGFEENE